MQEINSTLWVLPVLAQVALLIRLLYTGSWRRSYFLSGLLVFTLVATLIGNVGYDLMSRSAYSRFWVTAYICTSSLIALALTESCVISLENYARFGKVGRRIIRSVLIASALAMLATLFVVPDEMAQSFWSYLQAQAYLVYGSLSLLGLCVLLFARWARLQLIPNARMIVVVLTLACGMEGLLGSGISTPWASVSFTLGILWSTACWLYLAVRWSTRPEPVRPRTGDGGELDIAPALSRMSAANRDLADLVRRG